MNKWEAIVLVIALLVVAFIAVAYLLPNALPLFTSYTVDLIALIFGVALVVIVVNVFVGKGSRR